MNNLKIFGNNKIINQNLCILYSKLKKFLKHIESKEDEEFELFFNKLNLYFSNIVTEIKLNYFEEVKKLQKNLEKQMNVIKDFNNLFRKNLKRKF